MIKYLLDPIILIKINEFISNDDSKLYMACYICSKEASFICHCSDKSICKSHLGEHLGTESNHQIEKLTTNLDFIEKIVFEKNLKTCINSLEELRRNVYKETKEIIQKIKSLNSLTIKKITNQINQFYDLMKKEDFLLSELDQMKNLLYTELRINTINTSKVIEAAKSFYSQDFFILTIEPENEKFLKSFKFLREHNGGFRCLAISSDSKTIITGSEDTTVRIWDLQSKNQLACLAEHKSEVMCIDLCKKNDLFVTGSLDRTLILWSLKRQSKQNTFYGHSGAILSACFNTDGGFIISTSSVKEIFVWNSTSYQCIKKINTTFSANCGICMPNNVFISGTSKSLEALDLISSNTIFNITAHNKAIRSVTTTSDYKFIITGSEDTSVKIWESSDRSLYASLEGHREAVLSVAVTENNKFVVSGACDKLIIMWDIESKTEAHKFECHSSIIFGVKAVTDFIISVSRDSRISLISLQSKTAQGHLSLTPFEVGSECIKDSTVAFGSQNLVIIHDLSHKSPNTVLQQHRDPVKSINISSTWKYLMSSSLGSSNNLVLWDFQSKSLISVLDGHLNSVFCVDISINETQAVSGDKDGKVILWSLSHLKQIFIFEGHTGQVYSVKFMNNGKIFASTGSDGKIFVWDSGNYSVLIKFDRKNLVFLKVFFTGDQKFLITPAANGGLWVWDLGKKTMKFCFKDFAEGGGFLENYKELKFGISKYLF